MTFLTPSGVRAEDDGQLPDMIALLSIIAAILVIFGIIRIVQGAVLWGALVIVAGLLVGPGGVSIFS
ncbi:MAG: GPGG-motif small membrane protein [Frankia sp.]